MPQININIALPIKEEPKPTTSEDIVWPTMLDDEEDEATMVELRFYDGATVKNPSSGGWMDVLGWNTDSMANTLWTNTKTFDSSTLIPYYVTPRNTTYEVIGCTDSKVSVDTIKQQYSTDNKYRWERKPLGTRPAEWRLDGGRWYTGGTYMYVDPTSGQPSVASDYGMFNFRVELTFSPDTSPAASIDPDKYHDGKARRLSMKYPHNLDSMRELVYRGSMPGRKLGVKITDQSKSYAHYVASDYSYAYDWIDGVYWCTFDTSDDINFKVTTEPTFDSDAVPGRIVMPGKWDVFMLPRRWLYRMKYTHHTHPHSQMATFTYAQMNCSCDEALFLRYEDENNQAMQVSYSESTSCHDDPPTNTDDAELEAWYVDVHHYEAFFWGRFPCNWTALWGHENGQPAMESTAHVDFRDTAGGKVGSSSLIWNPTYTELRTQLLAAGGSGSDAEELFTGGLSGNLHVCVDATTDYIKIGLLNGAGEGVGKLSQIGCTSYCGPVITRSEDNGTYMGHQFSSDNPNFGIGPLWTVIESSSIWADTIKDLRDGAKNQVGPTWVVGEQYLVGALLTLNNVLYGAIQQHVGADVNQPGIGAQWATYWAALSNWQAGTSYPKGAPVSLNGKNYLCTTTHVASDTMKPGPALSWQLGIAYAKNAVRVHQKRYYQARIGHTSATETEPGTGKSWASVWVQISPTQSVWQVINSDNAKAASRVDMIPFGVAVSPSRIGDLVGIIKTREKPYFVWRKTNEILTPHVVGATRLPIRFESQQADGKLGPFLEGPYVGSGFSFNSDEHNAYVYDADYADLWIGDGNRKLTGVGRDVTAQQGSFPPTGYACITAHTSSADNEPVKGSSWQADWSEIHSWMTEHYYGAGYVTREGTSYYRATQSHTGTNATRPGMGTNWSSVWVSITNTPAWQTGLSFSVGDVTLHLDMECPLIHQSYAVGADTPAVYLDSPAFVMLSKEHAFDDVNWHLAIMDGANANLGCRCARCNDFDHQTAAVRNSY